MPNLTHNHRRHHHHHHTNTTDFIIINDFRQLLFAIAAGALMILIQHIQKHEKTKVTWFKGKKKCCDREK